jgi:hypothetical protein
MTTTIGPTPGDWEKIVFRDDVHGQIVDIKGDKVVARPIERGVQGFRRVNIADLTFVDRGGKQFWYEDTR